MGLFKNVFFHCTYSIKIKIFNNYLFDDAKYHHFLRRADQLFAEAEGWGCQTSSTVIAIDRAENGERNWGDTLINYVKPRKNPDCFAVYAQCCTKTETFVRVIVLLYRSPTFPTLSGTAGYQAVRGSRKFRKEWPGHLPAILTENSIKILQNFKEKRSGRGFLVPPPPPPLNPPLTIRRHWMQGTKHLHCCLFRQKIIHLSYLQGIVFCFLRNMYVCYYWKKVSKHEPFTYKIDNSGFPRYWTG